MSISSPDSNPIPQNEATRFAPMLEFRTMPDDKGGFVRIYRSILENPTFRDIGEAMFFAFLVLKANWRSGERRYDERVYKLERGDLVLGERKLGEGFDWSRQKLRGVMARLEAADMLTRKWVQHGDQRAPVITICNYSRYQDVKEALNQGSDQGRPNVGPPKKEGKEVKEDNTVDSTADQQFDEFWRTYPSRGRHSNPKKTARAKFKRAVKRGIASANIIRGAENYAAYVEREGTDPKYVAQAKTWLNEERWAQYQEQEAAGSKPTPLML